MQDKGGGQVLRFEFGLCKLNQVSKTSSTSQFIQSKFLDTQDLAP